MFFLEAGRAAVDPIWLLLTGSGGAGGAYFLQYLLNRRNGNGNASVKVMLTNQAHCMKTIDAIEDKTDELYKHLIVSTATHNGLLKQILDVINDIRKNGV